MKTLTVGLKKLAMATGLCLSLLLSTLPIPAFAQGTNAIRPGDMLEISISGVPASEASLFNKVYTVAEDGSLNLAYVGRISVGGTNSDEAERRIESAYVAAQIFTNPAVTINMSANRFVNVEGAVRAPQRVPFTSDLTLLSAITACGGFNEFADPKRVVLSRGNKAEFHNAVEIRKRPELDPRLQPGDKVFVRQSWF